jgi:hypothetical protein
MTSHALKVSCGLLLLSLVGCQTSKSSTPTAPTVAGPIAGVTITAPVLVSPSQGFKFKESEQPIQLVIQNATTSGVRALTYTFEVASDQGFTTKVFGRSNVPPGDGKTSVTIDRLDIGRTYYWRAWAEDGANTGAAATAGFEIYPKASVNAPTPASPINSALVSSTTPTLMAGNAAKVGPVGPLGYDFQVGTDQTFGHLAAGGIVPEGSGQTSFTTNTLPNGATLYWRVRANDGETASAWSATQVFKTPAAPAPSPSPGPTPAPGGGGSCASKDGNAIIKCISAKYPALLAAGVSLSTRQSNMSFLRDRIIEAGKCGGLDLGWNLKRGGPDISIDFITERVNGQVIGHDIAFDYDNTSTTLVLYWGDGTFPAYAPYTNSFSCG